MLHRQVNVGEEAATLRGSTQLLVPMAGPGAPLLFLPSPPGSFCLRQTSEILRGQFPTITIK